jgi:hypothetical protein
MLPLVNQFEAISRLNCGVESIVNKKTREFFCSPEFNLVQLCEFRVLPCLKGVAIEAILLNQLDFNREVRILAEGEHDVLGPFADKLGDLLFSSFVNYPIVLEQNICFRETVNFHVSIVKCKVGKEHYTVGLGTSEKDSLTASLKAICAALSHHRAILDHKIPQTLTSFASTCETEPSSESHEFNLHQKTFLKNRRTSWFRKYFLCK